MSEAVDISELLEDTTIENQTYLKALENRVIILNGEIKENLMERVIIPLLNFEHDNSHDPVTLYIQTEGGSVADGLPLCSVIDNYSKPLNIIVLGYALSMGTIILCSGNNNPNVTKYCYPFSYALHHSGSMSLFGEGNVVKDSYDFLDKLDRRINNYIVANTGITKEELEDNSRKQWFLTAEEMKEKRLVDRIIGVDD